MIALGSFDASVSEAARAAYVQQVGSLTQLPLASVKEGLDKLVPQRHTPSPGEMSVAQVQAGLEAIGFFPGATIDGIFGYRTLSALRLFQEYVRSVEKRECTPDGRFGSQTQAHLQRWMHEGRRTTWTPAIDAWRAGTPQSGEYAEWLQLLERVKAKYLAAPDRVLQRVNAFTRPTDTRKVANWDFSPAGNIHFVGIRRQEFTGKFDDIFVLLIKGLVFKFQGSTEPGASSNPGGPPYLVPGQHDYRFGWHQKTYLALRPRSSGVLVIRAGTDRTLDDSDLARGFHVLGDINIHWGGLGVGRAVGNWSEGCQVINGNMYLNAANELVSCASYAATSSSEPTREPGRTRGAYNVLVDLVTALGSDLPGNTVKYTLLSEGDLALAPALADGLANARQQVVTMAKG